MSIIRWAWKFLTECRVETEFYQSTFRCVNRLFECEVHVLSSYAQNDISVVIYFMWLSVHYQKQIVWRSLQSEPQDRLQQYIRRHCNTLKTASKISDWGIGRSLMLPNLESKMHGATVQSHIFQPPRLPIVLYEQKHCRLGSTKHQHAVFLGV